jgi:hypothetical protein
MGNWHARKRSGGGAVVVPLAAVLTYADGVATVSWTGDNPPAMTVDGLLLVWAGSSWMPAGAFPAAVWSDGHADTETELGGGRYYARLSLNGGDSYLDSPELVL